MINLPSRLEVYFKDTWNVDNKAVFRHFILYAFGSREYFNTCKEEGDKKKDWKSN